MRRFFSALALLLSLAWQYAHAESPAAGLHYSHKNWEVVCDNTRTCRAAGYQADSDEAAVSLLLVREAGPDTAVSAKVQIGSYLEDEALEALSRLSVLTLWINGKPHGTVELEDTTGKLSAEQVSALLAVLPRSSQIEWRAGEERWVLSDSGATAVLLKMDEFQGRIGTPGALVRKGTRREADVLPPLPVPVITAAPIAVVREKDKRFENEYAGALLTALRTTLTEDECSLLYEADTKPSVNRLSDKLLLVSAPCELSAYNYDTGYWLMADQLPYTPEPIPVQANEYAVGTLRSSHKGRGLGDCWSFEEWTWNGETFIQSASSSTGMCKLVAPGGAWRLPTLITTVQAPAEAPSPIPAPKPERLLQVSPQVGNEVGIDEMMRAVRSGILAVFPMVDKSTITLSFREAYAGVDGFIPERASFSLPQALLLGEWDDKRKAGMAEELLAAMPIGPINGCPTVVIDDQWFTHTVESDPEKPLRVMGLEFMVGC